MELRNSFLKDRFDVLSMPNSELYGYGITDDAIIFGTEGLNSYQSGSGPNDIPTEGRFAGFFKSKNKVIIKTDRTGQELLYLFRRGSEWSISNSFMMLARHVGRTHKIHLNRAAVLSLHLKHGVHIGEQLISHQTMIEEIKVIPTTSELHVDLRTGELREITTPYHEFYAYPNGMNYTETMHDFLERGSGMLRALAETGFPMNLLLSGGYDSRLALMLLAVGGAPIEELRVTSYPHKVDDFRAVQALHDVLGFRLNHPAAATPTRLSTSDSVRAYFVGCGATYLPCYPIKHHAVEPRPELRLTGDQPTGWDHFFGTARFNGSASKIADDIREWMIPWGSEDEVVKLFFSNFETMDVDPESNEAMFAHYSMVRSRHHYGRSFYRSLGTSYLFAPLMQSVFVPLTLEISRAGKHPKTFFADAFSAHGGWPLETPFETADRAFDADSLSESPFSGGIQIQPRSFSIFGKPDEQSLSDDTTAFDIPCDFPFKEQDIKHHFATMFHRARHARGSDLFLREDEERIRKEIREEGTLSHGIRKLCHLVSTDILMQIVAGSDNRTAADQTYRAVQNKTAESALRNPEFTNIP